MTREFELKWVIENIQLELDYTDLEPHEEKAKQTELAAAKAELKAIKEAN